MRRVSKGEIHWLEFEILAKQQGLRHGVFLRHGGVSSGVFSSLNMSSYLGDLSDNVLENRKRIRDVLGADALHLCRQPHGTSILFLDREHEDKKEISDGMITDRVGVGLMIRHADCQAAIFYDPPNRVIGNIHVGWRGNVKDAYRAMVEKMRSEAGSKPENLLVGVSPSLGPMYAEFIHYRQEFPKTFWSFQTRPNYFDLWAISRQQLLDVGVLAEHIEFAGICTYENARDFFSFRRDQRVTGSHATVVLLD